MLANCDPEQPRFVINMLPASVHPQPARLRLKINSSVLYLFTILNVISGFMSADLCLQWQKPKKKKIAHPLEVRL